MGDAMTGVVWRLSKYSNLGRNLPKCRRFVLAEARILPRDEIRVQAKSLGDPNSFTMRVLAEVPGAMHVMTNRNAADTSSFPRVQLERRSLLVFATFTNRNPPSAICGI
jgi:hypothetical protein